MRRKDREMNKEFGIEIIDKSKYGILSMIGECNKPSGIPLSIVRSGNTLYFHSAMGGRKVEAFERNPNVGVTFVGETKVPENYTKEELDEIIKDESKILLLISKVFTTEYESVIVMGEVKLVNDENEKIKAIGLICKKYTPAKMEYISMAIKAGLRRTNVYSIEIGEITAKRKRYDMHGEEMKWGRMD